MPKSAAPSPAQWATTHPNFSGFSIDELNRVVLDYAQIELEAAERRSRRPVLVRLIVKLLFFVAVIGLAGPLFAAIVFIAGSNSGDMSNDPTVVGFVVCVYVGCGLGCISLLYRFIPWVRSSHRQWDRSLFGFSVIVLVPTVALLVAVAVSDPAVFNRPIFLVAPLITLLLSVGVIVAEFRLYSQQKPPAVDVSGLSEREIQVLLDLRHKALETLRSRSIVSYEDFDDFDHHPLVSVN